MSIGNVLALVLVVITAYYAWQTYRMVSEMQRARLAGIEPRLVPVVEYDHPVGGTIYVENIGLGAAFDLDLTLTFEPNGTTFRLRRYLLRPGARRFWNPAHTGQQENLPQVYHPDAHLPNHTHIHVTGSFRDLLGRRHAIDERTPVENRWETRFMDRWITGDTPPPTA